MQTTIKRKVEYRGKGLHTGKPTHMVFLPAPPNTGICFCRADIPGKPVIPAKVEYFHKMPFMCSCISDSNGTHIQLIEHLMAAFHSFHLDNLIVELDNEEPPFEDGSARFIGAMINQAGLKSQEAPDRTVRLEKPIIFKEGDVELTAFPSESLRVSCFVSYSNPIVGDQWYSLKVTSESFMKEIAPARTFCFEEDVKLMFDQNLLKGAGENSALVFGKQGLLQGSLNFPDEPVRHKILDLIGDLYLLGAPLLAHITAVKSGHFSHARFVNKIKKETGL